MCNRYNIVELQQQAEASQVSRRNDGTPIYRFGPDKWADAHTLQGLLVKVAAHMEALQARLMNYQTGLARIKGAQRENVNR